ncbi:MAG: hypothetical protein IPK03_01815 [Bacteroidetes bacterium]|nr:hypothetical protein [Bacteroidota bacterium]
MSRHRIEEKLGHKSVSISYPVGSYNEMTIKLSKAAGYSLGLAVKKISITCSATISLKFRALNYTMNLG